MPTPSSGAQASSVAKPASMATPGQSSQSSVAKPAVTTIDDLAFFLQHHTEQQQNDGQK